MYEAHTDPVLREMPVPVGLADDEAATLAKMAKQIPLGRLGMPGDVAQAVIYLASDESRFMTGAELKLDGGISAM